MAIMAHAYVPGSISASLASPYEYMNRTSFSSNARVGGGYTHTLTSRDGRPSMPRR